MSKLRKIREFNLHTFKGIAAIKSEDGDSYLIPSGAVFPNGIKLDKLHKVKLISPSHKEKRLRVKDILFNTGGEGTLGRSNYFALDNGHYYSDSFVLTIRNKDEQLDEHFLFYSLNHFSAKKQIENLKVGTTGITSIKENSIKEIELFVPEDIVEQTQIATILSTLDQAIDATEQLISKYQRIKTGLLHDLLTRGIDKSGNLRSEKTHQFKDSPLGRIPVEWEIEKLAMLSDISSGITLGKTYEGPDTIELPYLRVANVQDGYLDLAEITTIRLPKGQVKRFTLEVGDVLMNEGGDFDKLGRGTIWQGKIPLCLHQNHVFKVRTYRNKLLPEFLEMVSQSPYGKKFFIISSKQSTNLS